MLGKHSGKEKEGDLGGLLFSLHFSIAYTVLVFFFFFPIKPKERNRTEAKYKWVLLTVSAIGGEHC